MKESMGLIACPDYGGSDDIILTQKRDEPEMTVVAKGPSPSQVQQNKESVILKKGKFADAKYDSFRRSAKGYNVVRELYRNDKNYWYTYQYKKYNWAQYDYTVRKGDYQGAQDKANKRKEENMKYTYGAVIGLGVIGTGGLAYYTYPVWLPAIGSGAAWTGRATITGLRYSWNFAKQPFVAAGGGLGPAAQTVALTKLINTGADATGQIIDLSINGGSWNYGSTFGNLYFSNPFVSSAPGALYDGLTNSNATITSVSLNYGLGAIAGFGGDKLPINSGVRFTITLNSGVGGNMLKKQFEKK